MHAFNVHVHVHVGNPSSIRPALCVTYMCMHKTPTLPVTPAQLMRPGIGRNASCALGDCLTSIGLRGCSQPRELWFFDILMYSVCTYCIHACTYTFIHVHVRYLLSLALQNVSVADISASRFFDYTGRAQRIREGVKAVSDVSDCCNYDYQLLDKYCASLSPVSGCTYMQIDPSVHCFHGLILAILF